MRERSGNFMKFPENSKYGIGMSRSALQRPAGLGPRSGITFPQYISASLHYQCVVRVTPLAGAVAAAIIPEIAAGRTTAQGPNGSRSTMVSSRSAPVATSAR